MQYDYLRCIYVSVCIKYVCMYHTRRNSVPNFQWDIVQSKIFYSNQIEFVCYWGIPPFSYCMYVCMYVYVSWPYLLYCLGCTVSPGLREQDRPRRGSL